MSPTEQRYAQIEKEALGITWASERFADYLIGLKFHIETDHKLLFPLLSSKNLSVTIVIVTHRPLRHAICSEPCGKIKCVVVASSSTSHSLIKLTLHP